MGKWQFQSDGDWCDCDNVIEETILRICEQVRQLATFELHGFRYTLELGRGIRHEFATGKTAQLRWDPSSGQDQSRVGCKSTLLASHQSLVPGVFVRQDLQDAVPSCSRGPPSKRSRLELEEEGCGELEDSKSTGNERLAEIFEEMGAIQRVKRDFFRARAYEKAVDLLRAQWEPIQNAKQARRVKGIGDGIARRIEEVLKTGSLKELDELKRDDDVICLRELRKVHGIGVVRAEELLKKGIRSIGDLRQAVAVGEVLLNDTQSVGLAYVDDCRKRIPRLEMVEHEALIQGLRATHQSNLISSVCGSYRRGKATSGDIDVLITAHGYTSLNPTMGHTILPAFVNQLSAAGYLIADLALGEKKYMGVCKLPGYAVHRRIDIRCLPSDQFHFGTLYFTGSKELNVRMRLQASQLGLTLSEYSLTRRGTGDKVAANSEKDIFQALGMEYLEPHDR